ncbi:peptidoglycan-binding domain-containing protein [Luteibacter sp.]|uniref:peptidoglycan-binding domain-containing protein n=1 Tax=Luteibacter sp. TaxID=1886636 RepID=UPI002809774E|nr:peptidoglycan-binding domain-containing protein [Luteibacter sp.]MDQ8049487.1 peptidoglycan-binding domain-containing protein [Luteibacter sp.]
MDRNHWKLGDTSALFESQGSAGTVSLGVGDHGGASYGIYQLSSKAGTAQEFVNQSSYASDFHGLQPGSEAFNNAWKKVAEDHADFGAEQQQFIKRTHVDPVTSSLAARGIDISARGPAVQDMVWSMSVQYRANTPSRIERGINEAYGAGADLSTLSDADIVRAVQQSKLVHVNQDFASSAPTVRQGVETRIRAEESALVRLAETGSVGTVAQTTADWNSASPVHHGSSRERIVAVQEKLRDAGILTSKGEPLVADGDFGPSTRAAVSAFQSSVGLPPTGSVGALTMHRLEEQSQTRSHLQEQSVTSQRAAAICRLDDVSHPDNDFFRSVRQHVANLDASLGRVPDQHTDNIASSLTVQARADGMHRVDQIALSTTGDAMWAVQTPVGRSDHLFDLRTCVPTSEASTTMEQSAARWPEAMQQFQGHEQAQQQSQQRAMDRQQTESQAQGAAASSLVR